MTLQENLGSRDSGGGGLVYTPKKFALTQKYKIMGVNFVICAIKLIPE